MENRQYPVIQKQAGPDRLIRKMQNTVVLSLALGVFCLTAVFVMSIFSIMTGDIVFGTALAVGLIFLLWKRGGAYLYAPALLGFARHYQRQDLFECKKAILPFLTVSQNLPIEKDINVACLHNAIGVVHLHNGDYDLAQGALEEAVRIAGLKRIFDSKAISKTILATMMSNLCLTNIRLENLDEAEQQGINSVRLWQEQKPQLRTGELFPRINLGEIALAREDYNLADQEFERARFLAQSGSPPAVVHPSSWHWALTMLYMDLTYAKLKKGDNDGAQVAYQLLTEHVYGYQPCGTTLAMHSALRLAEEYMTRKEFDRAETILDIGYVIGQNSPYHPDCELLIAAYKKLLEETDRVAEIEDLKRWVRPVLLGVAP